MKRVLVGFWSVSTIVLLSGCGSAGRSDHGSSAPSASVTARLTLAPGGNAKADAGAPALAPARPTSYVLDATLPDLGASGLVWRMTPHPPSGDDVQRFASALGVAGTPVRTSTGWVVTGPESSLAFYVSGNSVAVSYAFGAPGAAGGSTGSGGTAVDGSGVADPVTKAAPPDSGTGGSTTPAAPTLAPPVDVPAAGEAQSIARSLLDRLGVLAGQQWSAAVTDSGGTAVSCATGTDCPTEPARVFARTVTFALMLGGIRVNGVDWSVTIGEHRRVESLYGEWATPSPAGSYPLATTSAVFAELQHGNAKYSGPQPLNAEVGAPVTASPASTAESVVVHVSGVSMGLARWDAYLPADTAVDLVPTYRFHVISEGAIAYDIELLALDPGVVTFSSRASTSTAKPLPPQPVQSAPGTGGKEPS